MSSPEEGGTRIQRRAAPPPPPPQQQQQQQQMPMNDPYSQQQEMPQQHHQQEHVYQHVPPPRIMSQPPRGILKSTSQFGKGFVNYDSVTFKYAVIVTCIFLLLNSKIIWKQIIQFPFMGGMEPSLIALIINSILAGVIFYILSNFT